MRRTSQALKWAGFSLALALSLLAVYALLFPGEGVERTWWTTSWTAVAWLTPVLVLVVVARRWPAAATVTLSVGTALFVAIGIWYLIDPVGWESWEGPNAIRGTFAMVLLVPTAVLGLHRTGFAGLQLVIIGAVLPISMSLAGVGWSEFLNGPEASVSIVSLTVGVLYVLSALTLDAGTHPPRGHLDGPRTRGLSALHHRDALRS